MPEPAAILTCDLDAVAWNWRLLRDRHAPGATAAVVKADGYGLGAAAVARRLHREGCRHFFAAHLAEAAAIAPLLPNSMVCALNGLWEGDGGEYLAHGVLPTLGSLPEIAAWRDLARRRGAVLPALLHVDTGMSRLGLDANELATLAADPSLLAGIGLRFVMTHLASSERPRDRLNRAQLERFGRACARLPDAPRSLAASSGLFLGDAYRSDLARPGAALYGINPVPGRPNPMRNPVSLRARVVQMRDVAPGDTVGYNGIWRAARPSRIATVSVGYADGFSRRLSNAAVAHFDGRALPLVGRVSMDLTTFDATHLPDLKPGEWLDLIGPCQDADAVAAKAGTNAYEVLTTLGRRYRRDHPGA